ncbi:mitochondrial import inner membrane translocase subunit Tim29 [Stomoxys calcitrans]|uniref:Mitochondrial import inner membrane translocase subunit Tim29 n=1 Tax=Stomoxys calcitrans TaxID=35570 RepID=A0A1I8PNC4_STOCA|nr:mitochondrial import inner membrane translocase subunit Tim29 [Stomoxys calcitrans]
MRFFSFSNRLASLRARVDNTFTLPERFKGTFVERLTNYWKGLLTDYKDVAVGIVKESIEKPKKAIFYGVTGYSIYLCGQRNPSEEDFIRQFRLATNEMILVNPSLQNPTSDAYLRRLQEDINQRRLRFLSLGILTLMWEDLYDSDDCTYPAICEYTKVSFWSIPQHVIDVGFWNKFWRLKYELHNYDVNYL